MHREISILRNTQTRQSQGDKDKRLAGYAQRLRLLQRLQSKQLQSLKEVNTSWLNVVMYSDYFICISLHRFKALEGVESRW